MIDKPQYNTREVLKQWNGCPKVAQAAYGGSNIKPLCGLVMTCPLNIHVLLVQYKDEKTSSLYKDGRR